MLFSQRSSFLNVYFIYHLSFYFVFDAKKFDNNIYLLIPNSRYQTSIRKLWNPFSVSFD